MSATTSFSHFCNLKPLSPYYCSLSTHRSHLNQGIKKNHRSQHKIEATNKKGLIGFVPLQFCEFGVMPLLFVYLETCHYNFPSTRLVPFSTLESSLGPFADRIVRMELIPRLKLPLPIGLERAEPQSLRRLHPLPPPPLAYPASSRVRRHRRLAFVSDAGFQPSPA